MEDSKEDELDRLAREELTKEAKRGAERAREIGAYGWVKRPGATTDKKFLGNVLVSTLRSNKRKPSRDQDHRPHRRKYDDKRDSHEHSRHSYHPRHHPPKLVNGGYFRYNDQRRYSHSENGKNEEKEFSEKHARIIDRDDSQGNRKSMSVSDRLKDEEKEEKSSEHEKSYQKELCKEHKKDFKNKKCRDDKKDRQKKTAKERRKKEKSKEEEQYIHSDEGKVKITGKKSDSDLISEKTYHKDTGQGHRRRNISSISEEESLLEDIKKHKDSDDDKNPQEKIIDIFGDYLIEKKQKKKKNKHKSHKAKHKHKKHKQKHDKANEDS
ncbi:pre-mRNA-splicing factor 38B-like [Mytilus californianus]|uniref:pre-mRNA-splicing factor 38B-like n=1 Tax=Mytilus californianus TaxID=6549 RepID=UPI00224606E4|nr:pre-mRNA-splicing factor 38B-like [Mytilus californianus]